MARVVLIHGVGQQSSTAQAQLSEWIPSLVKGILLSKHPDAGQVATEFTANVDNPLGGPAAMAFYGDLMLGSGVQGETISTPETETVAEALAVSLLQTAAKRGDPRLMSEARSILGQIESSREGVQGAGAVARGAMSRLDGRRWLTARIFGLAQRARPDLLQVARYLSEGSVRAQIQTRIRDLFSDDTCLVIGHSLGSVAGWEACQNVAHRLPVLLTIGSPLGLDTVVYSRLQPQPPTFPRHVDRWVNVAHPDDVVAVEPCLAALFPSPDQRQVEDHEPRSSHDHHAAATYLEQPIVGCAVVEAYMNPA